MSTKPRQTRKPANRPADPAATDPRAGLGSVVLPEDETNPVAFDDQADADLDEDGEDEDAADPFDGLGDRDVADAFDPDARRGLNNFGRIMSEIDLMNPADRHQPSKAILEGMRNAPIFAAAQVEGQESWLVECQNPWNELPENLDKVARDVTWATFIRRYLDAMPEPHSDEPAIFHLKPLDKAGRPLSTKQQVIRIPWHHPVLKKIRESSPSSLGKGVMDPNSIAIRLLEQQAENARKDRDAAMAIAAAERQRAAELTERTMLERINAASADAQSLGTMYGAVNTIQKEGFNTLLTTQNQMAAEREAREAARIQRELADREDARKREREEREDARKRDREEREAALKQAQEDAKAERERLRADNDARLAAAKQEAEARLAAIKAETEQKEAARKEEAAAREAEAERKLQIELARIKAEADKATAAAEKETARLKAEADERAAARKLEFDEREAARKLEREREDRMRLDELTRRENAEKEERARRADEQLRRDKLDADEKERNREHQKVMEQMRQDLLKQQEARLERERAADKEFRERDENRSKEHLQTMVKLVDQRTNADKPDIVAMIEKGLNTFGLTPGALLEGGKKLLPLITGLTGEGQSGGMGVTIVKGIFDSIQEGIKRIPISTGEEDGDWEEEEEEEEVAPAPRKPRRLTQRAPEPKVVPTPRVKEPVVRTKPKGPGLDAFTNSLPDAPPVPAVPTPTPEAPPVVPTMPSEPAPPGTISIAEARAGRQAVADLVEVLESAEDWEAAVMGLDATDELMRYVTRVGLVEALEGYDIDISKVATTLGGLFGEVPMVGVKP